MYEMAVLFTGSHSFCGVYHEGRWWHFHKSWWCYYSSKECSIFYELLYREHQLPPQTHAPW